MNALFTSYAFCYILFLQKMKVTAFASKSMPKKGQMKAKSKEGERRMKAIFIVSELSPYFWPLSHPIDI